MHRSRPYSTVQVGTGCSANYTSQGAHCKIFTLRLRPPDACRAQTVSSFCIVISIVIPLSSFSVVFVVVALFFANLINTIMSIVTSTTRQPFTHTVEVGKAGYTFSPDTLLAEVGDYITYAFYPRNHSVIRSDYGYPCIPYGLVNTRPGFYSPFMPVDAILETPPTFTVRVNDTEPIFVYCSGPVACNEYGMVAVVNPTANTSLEVHRQKAKKASYVLQPGMSLTQLLCSPI